MSRLKKLALTLGVTLAVGGVAGFIVKDAPRLYNSIVRPVLAPPSVVFPIVWSVLYILMGIAAYIVISSDSEQKGAALKNYNRQLTVNFFWAIVFFNTGWFLAALILLLLLWLLIVQTISDFHKIEKRAAYLMLPYLVWTTFAVYLNLAVYLLNR